MNELLKNHGALIECGEIDGWIYELRDEVYPLLTVYRREGDGYLSNQTQLGGLSVDVLARQLIREANGVS